MVEKQLPQSKLEWVLEGYPALKQALQATQQVVWLADPNTDQILFASRAFKTVWGRSCESLYADPLLLIESVHPEDRVKVMSARPGENRRSQNQTYRIVRPDGSLRWISAHTFLVSDDSAESTYQVCIAQDITDQHQVDETLRKALDRSREQFTLSRRMSLARKPDSVLRTLMSASALRPAQRALVLFFDSSPGGSVHAVDVIASWSPVASLDSLSPSEVLGDVSLFDELASLDLLHPARPVIVTDIASDERLAPGVRDALLEEQVRALAIFPLVAMGNWLGCLLVFFGQEKRFEPLELRHIKVLVDQATITLYNLQLLEIESASRHEAEQANEIKTRFLAMISHELRTPLTSIKGFTTTLLAEDVVWEPEEQRDFIQTIQAEANRLQELIDHLLDLSRLEAGMLPIAQKPYALRDILEEAMPQFLAMTSRHTFSTRLPARLPPVFVDAKRMIQVMANLVHNAVLYTPAGTEIALTAGGRGGFLQVNVIDQGPGIPPAEHKRVFQAFQRGVSEENGAGNGAGLGLAICKGLVEAHGGRIWIKKHTRSGTTISFTIPLAPARAPAADPGEG